MSIIPQPFRYILVYLFLFLHSFIYFGCNTSGAIQQSADKPSNLQILQDKISYIISDPNLFNAQIGLYIESIENSETVFANNEHKLFISASNMKIFTTATALLRFGPRFTYKNKNLSE